MSLVDTDISTFPGYPALMDKSGSAFTFDTSTDVLAVVFLIPKTGTISNIHYRIGARTTPSMTRRIELRTVDTTTGLPNAAGTLYGSSTSITVDASGDSANTNMTAAVNATATKGDLVALVFDLSAFTSGSFTMIDNSGSLLTPFSIGNSARELGFPYGLQNTAGSNVLSTVPMTGFSLEYAGVHVPVLPGMSYVSVVTVTQTTNSGSNQRVGNAFTPLTPRRTRGFYALCDIDGVASFQLRKQSDSSIVATATVNKNLRGTTLNAMSYYEYDGGATFNPVVGTGYYIFLEGGDATGGLLWGTTSGVSTAALADLPGGSNCYGVTFDGSTYTAQTTANSVGRYFIGLMSDQEDNGVGGGGGVSLARVVNGGGF